MVDIVFSNSPLMNNPKKELLANIVKKRDKSKDI